MTKNTIAEYNNKNSNTRSGRFYVPQNDKRSCLQAL